MKLWIARDEYGNLTLHHNKPEYVYDENYRMSSWSYGGCIGEIYEKLFPEITFKNSPQEVEIKLKNELSFEEMEELIDDLI